MDGHVSQFLKRHYRHFNAATLVDAAQCAVVREFLLKP